ncbi:hypothetical protein PCE1_000924 [Barthelona sp. PCE]
MRTSGTPIRNSPSRLGRNESNSLLSGLDLDPYADLDPLSAEHGMKIIFSRSLPVELRSITAPTTAGSQESLTVKLATLEDQATGTVSSIKMEITSEADLFFFYTVALDNSSYRILAEEQRLMADFDEFCNVLIRMLNSAIKTPYAYPVVFFLGNDNTGRLDFIQNTEFKYLELLSLNFEAASEKDVRDQIDFRYKSLKAKSQLLQARINDINSLVKVKNPSLLLQLQRENYTRLPKKM